ncbi:MAG: hypothetical protein ACRC6A_09200 [Fusobacteriaceae bacterium]
MISLFKHTADVWEYVETKNEWNQVVQEWILKHEGLRCTFGKKAINSITNSDFTTSLVKYVLHVPLEIEIVVGSKIIFKETNQIFKAQFSMPYTYLKKKEIELQEWV